MILFNTNKVETFNYIIHNFLEIEIFDDITDIGDMIEELMPKYLYREQYLKCKKTFEELFYWTQDEFYHRMSAFHELALYEFIVYLDEMKDELPNFDEIFFDAECREVIKNAAKEDFDYYKDKIEDDEEWSLEGCESVYTDVTFYIDELFEDTDFLLVADVFNSREYGNGMIPELLGINIDFYFELLPMDIQEKYKTQHITLTGEVSALIDYINLRAENGNLYKLFWENDIPVKEDRIQLILDNIIDAYFHNKSIDISREPYVGNGKVDFKLYKNENIEEKILIEIKRASSSYLKKRYEEQLTGYMKSGYKNAFYLIVCFTDEEYETAMKFIRQHVYTDTIQLYINISILDVRKRKTPSAM